MQIFTKVKTFLLSLILTVSAAAAFAQVTITQPTEGTAISADKAVGGKSQGYTVLGDITIADESIGDFQVGTDRKIYLETSQSHWQIKPGTGTLIFDGADISDASILVEADKITITYTVTDATASNNFLTIRGIAVQSTTTLRETTPATLRRSLTLGANSGTINGFGNNAIVANLAEVAGDYKQLQILLPGETAAPATPSGKTGTPTERSSGTQFAVVINAVDSYFNRITTNTDMVRLTATDANATIPADDILAAGTRTALVTLRSLGTFTISATNVTLGSAPVVSNSVDVTVGVFSRLQLLMPGEFAAPGTVTGKTGSPNAQTVGVAFPVIVNAVDAGWNIIATANDEVRLTSSDVNATMPPNIVMVNGVATFSSVVLLTASNRTLTATDVTDNNKTSNNSPAFTVLPGAYAKLQVLLPGESAVPGTPTGKTGVPTDRNSGTAFNVTVNAVDNYFNRVTSVSDNIHITTSDANASVPADNTLLNGNRSFIVTFRTLGSATVTATNLTSGGPAVVSSSANVTVGPFAKLQLLLPGEVAAPGTLNGKTNALPNTQTAGQPFNVRVNAVDAGWNLVNTVNDVVNFTATNDPYAELPNPVALVNGTLLVPVTYRIGNTTINRRLTVSDQTDNLKTANTSPVFGVNIGPYSRILVTLPGETYTPGHPAGKTGSPDNQGSGVAFNIAVRATDIAFNTVTTANPTIAISTTDPSRTLPPAAALTAGVKTNFSVKLNTIANIHTIRAEVTTNTSINDVTAPIPVYSPSSTTDFFRSVVTSGSWHTAASWETSADGTSNWRPSTLAPTYSAARITIRSNHNITIGAIASVDDVLIESNAQLILNANTLTITNGPAVIVRGVFRNNGRPINMNGVLQIDNGGTYQHNFNTTAGVIPTATWATGSTCEIVGYTSNTSDVLGSNQQFSDFIWNCPTQTAASSPALLGNFTARNFNVVSTGDGQLYLSSTGGGVATITGNYTQTAGKVNVNKTSGLQTLNVAGNFAVNSGTFASGSGTTAINFNGTTQSLVNNGTDLEFQNVTFGNGGTKTLSGGVFALAANGVLNLASGTTLNANGKLTILSTDVSSGQVAPLPVGAQITGNVTVQRFIAGGSTNSRTYRMLSSPVYDNGNSGNRKYSFTQFFNEIIITGTGGAANGFDVSVVGSNAASAWTYAGGTFVPLSVLNTSQSIGKGSYLFYRGNRAQGISIMQAPFAIPDDTVVDFIGSLNQGPVNVALENGLNLVGNPYASSITWNSGITKTGLADNAIRIWNPSIRQYAVFDGVVAVPEDNGGSNIIPSGQGFFVMSSGVGALTFTEAAKTIAQPPVLLMSVPETQKSVAGFNKIAAVTVSNETVQSPSIMRAVLSKDGISNKVETAIVFQQGKSDNFVTGEDIKYMKGEQLFLSSLSKDAQALVINYLPELSGTSKFKLDLDASNTNGNYQMQIKYSNIPSGYLVKLNDAFLGTSTVAPDGYTHSFSIDKSQAASYGANRFSVSFEAPTTLPVAYQSFTAAKVLQGVAVKWSTLSEVNNNRFEIHRSGEDKVFEKIHVETAKGEPASYSFLDRKPLKGKNYYKLLQFDNNDQSTETKPQVVNYDDAADLSIVQVYPNPVVDKFTLRFNGELTTAKQTIKITAVNGQVLLSKSVSKGVLEMGYELDISSLPAGTYIAVVDDSNAKRLGQAKLFKQ